MSESDRLLDAFVDTVTSASVGGFSERLRAITILLGSPNQQNNRPTLEAIVRILDNLLTELDQSADKNKVPLIAQARELQTRAQEMLDALPSEQPKSVAEAPVQTSILPLRERVLEFLRKLGLK